MTSKTPANETAAKKRGRPKKTDSKPEEKQAVEKKGRSISKTTAGIDGKKSVSKAKQAEETSEGRPQKSWEDIVHRADDELRASSVTISSIGSIISKRRSLHEPASASMTASSNPRFPIQHTSTQPQLRAQAAAMSTKTASYSSKKTASNAKARVKTQPPSPVLNGSLPPGYNKASRQWTGIIVSIPIVLVSSYWLYERLVLGKEQKMTYGNVLEKWFPDPDKNKSSVDGLEGSKAMPVEESDSSKTA